MPLPLTVSCSSKIQIGFTFLVPAYPGYPGKEAVKWLLLLYPVHSHVGCLGERRSCSPGSGAQPPHTHPFKSAPRSRQITMPVPHHSRFFTGRMPFLPPNLQHQSTEGNPEQSPHQKLKRFGCILCQKITMNRILFLLNAIQLFN